MFESAKAPVVPDNEENKALCRKYCPICQNYKKHDLHRNEPKELSVPVDRPVPRT